MKVDQGFKKYIDLVSTGVGNEEIYPCTVELLATHYSVCHNGAAL